MSLLELIKEAFRVVRTRKSLWLFGFVLECGIGSRGGSNNQPGAPVPGGGGGLPFPPGLIVSGIVLLVLLAAAALVVYFVSKGALIEGVVRARHGRSLGIREGFRVGWGHAGILFGIALLYFIVNMGSALLLAAPALMALALGSPPAMFVLAVAALVVAVPWLVTLYIWQAFAQRIAVIEKRRTLDAVRKARLFLHGRLMHGLKFVVAEFAGTVALVFAAILVLAPVAVLIAGASALIGGPLTVAIVVFVVLPAVLLLVAIAGTFQSSVWTIGYLSQVEHR